MRGGFLGVHRDLPLTLTLSRGRGSAQPSLKSAELILPPYPPTHNTLGFRDGRHELSHLCPETSGACPRLGSDIPKLRQGVRPGRGALTDRPHLPDALESGARASGKSPRTGCRGHHGHRRPPTGHPGVRRHPVPSHPSAPWRAETDWRARYRETCPCYGDWPTRRLAAHRAKGCGPPIKYPGHVSSQGLPNDFF